MSDAAIPYPPPAFSAWAGAAAPPSGPEPATHTHAWKEGGSFGFHDVLDALNPLQHIPVIGALYRWVTGDKPGNVARVVGDGLFGGPLGAIGGFLSVAFEEITGKDPGALVLSLFDGGGTAPPPAPTVLADATPPVKTPPAPTAPAAAASFPMATQAPIPLTGPAAKPGPAAPAAPSASATPSVSAAPTSVGDSERAFLAQTAAQSSLLQRSLQGQRAAAGGAALHPFTAPVPLQLTGGAALPRNGRSAASLAVPPAVDQTSAGPAAPSTLSAPAGAPIDVSQRMLDALDKYMSLEKQRGAAVDVVH